MAQAPIIVGHKGFFKSTAGILVRAGPQNPLSLQPCKPERLGEGSKMGKSPKVVRIGCKRSFKPMERKASCTGSTPGCTGAKQVCTWCKRLLGDLCAVGPKDLLHPLLTTFGDFPIFDPSPRRSGLQPIEVIHNREVKIAARQF